MLESKEFGANDKSNRKKQILASLTKQLLLNESNTQEYKQNNKSEKEINKFDQPSKEWQEDLQELQDRFDNFELTEEAEYSRDQIPIIDLNEKHHENNEQKSVNQTQKSQLDSDNFTFENVAKLNWRQQNNNQYELKIPGEGQEIQSSTMMEQDSIEQPNYLCRLPISYEIKTFKQTNSESWIQSINREKNQDSIQEIEQEEFYNQMNQNHEINLKPPLIPRNRNDKNYNEWNGNYKFVNEEEEQAENAQLNFQGHNQVKSTISIKGQKKEYFSKIHTNNYQSQSPLSSSSSKQHNNSNRAQNGQRQKQNVKRSNSAKLMIKSLIHENLGSSDNMKQEVKETENRKDMKRKSLLDFKALKAIGNTITKEDKIQPILISEKQIELIQQKQQNQIKSQEVVQANQDKEINDQSSAQNAQNDIMIPEKNEAINSEESSNSKLEQQVKEQQIDTQEEAKTVNIDQPQQKQVAKTAAKGSTQKQTAKKPAGKQQKKEDSAQSGKQNVAQKNSETSNKQSAQAKKPQENQNNAEEDNASNKEVQPQQSQQLINQKEVQNSLNQQEENNTSLLEISQDTSELELDLNLLKNNGIDIENIPSKEIKQTPPKEVKKVTIAKNAQQAKPKAATKPAAKKPRKK